jgi:apolipoprotein N-acyltransferase
MSGAPRPAPRIDARGAAVVSALLLTLAAPPSPFPPLALGALAPWAAAVALLPAGPGRGVAAARSGALLFGVHWGLLLLWVPRLVPRVGWWVIPGYLGHVALLALMGAGVGWLLARLVAPGGARGGVPLPLALALAWSAVEWARGSALGPFDFPWMGVVVPLAAIPELLQGAAWVGERGLALGVAAVNGALAVGLVRRARAPDGRRAALVPHWRPAGFAALAVALAWGAGAARMATLDARPVFTALAVQPAVPLEVEWSGGPLALAASMAALEALVPDSALTAVDLIVLPETAVPVVLDGPDGRGLRRTLAGWSRRTGVPLAVGAYGSDPDSLGGKRTNAVFLAGPEPDGAWPRADKRRLVPGVEWAPGDPSGLRSGPEPALLDVPSVGLVGVLVCIESAGPEPARTLRAAGARALVNVTNDAWLGDRPRWTRTAAFHQHPLHLRIRAVETGAGALRVGNGGWTSVVDPAGREQRLLEPYVPGVARAEVTSLAHATPFTRTGDLAGPGAAALAVLLWLISGARNPIFSRL